VTSSPKGDTRLVAEPSRSFTPWGCRQVRLHSLDTRPHIASSTRPTAGVSIGCPLSAQRVPDVCNIGWYTLPSASRVILYPDAIEHRQGDDHQRYPGTEVEDVSTALKVHDNIYETHRGNED
jgi:hypothetical protein